MARVAYDDPGVERVFDRLRSMLAERRLEAGPTDGWRWRVSKDVNDAFQRTVYISGTEIRIGSATSLIIEGQEFIGNNAFSHPVVVDEHLPPNSIIFEPSP
jgi:hypothetical protein